MIGTIAGRGTILGMNETGKYASWYEILRDNPAIPIKFALCPVMGLCALPGRQVALVKHLRNPATAQQICVRRLEREDEMLRGIASTWGTLG